MTLLSIIDLAEDENVGRFLAKEKIKFDGKVDPKKLKRVAIFKKEVADPKFAIIAREYVQFKNFKSSRKLPQDWDDYLSEDEDGNPESFMEEVLSGGKVVRNITQYIEDNQRMESLKNRILDAAYGFDQNCKLCHATL